MGNKFYPINLIIENKNCFVVGGGKVAFRKICGLLDANANIFVISPKICEEILNLVNNNKISWINKNFSADLIHDAFIIIAATNNFEINNFIADFAKNKNILVNVVNDFEGNFTVPSKIIRGDFLLTASTGGNSPAFSKFVRKMLEAEFNQNFGECLKIFTDFRLKVKNTLQNDSDRVKFWREILTPDVWQIIKSGDFVKLKKFLEEKL